MKIVIFGLQQFVDCIDILLSNTKNFLKQANSPVAWNFKLNSLILYELRNLNFYDVPQPLYLYLVQIYTYSKI